MHTSDTRHLSTTLSGQTQHSHADRTIGADQTPSGLWSWARENRIELPLLLLLDAARCDSFPKLAGTSLAFLRQHATLDCMQKWEGELTLLSALQALGDACAVSPYISSTYPPMPPEHSVARQLQGGELSQLPLVALIARPIPRTNPLNERWLATLRVWCFIQFLHAIHGGTSPSAYLVTVINKLRQAIDEESDWLDLFIQLQGPTESLHTLTRHLSSRATSLLSDTAKPIVRPSHRTMLAHLRNFCDGKEPENPSSLVTSGHGLFARYMQNPDSRVRWLDFGGPELSAQETSDDLESADLGTHEFDLPDSEPATLKVASVDSCATPPEQEHRSNGVLLAAVEDCQLLPFSWNRVNPNERLALERLLEETWRGDDTARQELAAMVFLAIQCAYSLRMVLTLQLSTESGEDWALDLQAGVLHRRPPRRYHGWRSSAETDAWVAPRADRIALSLPVAAHAALSRLVGACPDAATLETAWATRPESPEQAFREICQITPGLERVTSGMLAHWLEQVAYETSNDPILSRLLASHPRSGLPGACAYASFNLRQVHTALRVTNSGLTNKPVTPSPTDPLNGAGSELSPIEGLLRQACADALAEVNRLASDPGQWSRHHNALTAYAVVVLLACTGARPVKSPFESLEYFDLSEGHLYIEDKVSSRLHQGRVVPLPEAALRLIREHYLPHLARLAQVLEGFDPGLSQACASMARGKASPALPLFFLLGTIPELSWVEVSESSLSAVGIFRWPLPWNLMRHRLPTALKRAGLDHEIVNGLAGHGEQGTAAYGPYSMRIWADDAKRARPLLTQLLQQLEMGLPMTPVWPVTQAKLGVPPGRGSALSDKQNFGMQARRQRRQETLGKVALQATQEIEQFVGARPLESISPDEWEQLSRAMLLTPNGLPQAMGTLRYDTLQQWLMSRWAIEGQQPRLKRRYLPALEEASPFTAHAMGAANLTTAARRQLETVLSSLVKSKTSRRDALAIAVASLLLQSQVADPAVLQDLLAGRNFRLVTFGGSAYLEHAPGLDRDVTAPFRRYRLDGTAAALLARARAGSYRLEIADRPVPTEMQQIAEFCGLRMPMQCSTREWVQYWLPLVQQCNQLTLPGLVAAYLNGQIVTAALHHADWLRVHRGVAVQPPALERPAAANQAPDPEEEVDGWAVDADPETGDYVFFADELTAASPCDIQGTYGTGANTQDEASVRSAQHSSRALFQAIREALHRSANQKSSPRRELDAALRRVISEHRTSSRSCRLLAEWLRSLLWRRTSHGQISLRSLSRYLNALSPCFEAVAYRHDLLSCDEEEVTAFYVKIMDARRTIRPGSADVRASSAVATDTPSQATSATRTEEAPYQTWHLAFQLLRSFHQLMRRELAVEDPDWSEISPAQETLSISPGLLLEQEYLHALALAAPAPELATREELAVGFILLTAMRFGLRGAEATGLMRGDWVDTDHDTLVVLVQKNRHRSLKTPSARRQVPLLFHLTGTERMIVERFLALWEGISGGDCKVPLFASSNDPTTLLNERQLRWQASQLIKRATLNAGLSLHHARHAFANRVGLMLMDGTEGMWPYAAAESEVQSSHVRRLLLCTDQVTHRSLWALARLLGHAHPQTSVRSYLHVLPDLADRHVWKEAQHVKDPVLRKVPGIVQLDELAPLEAYLQTPEPSEAPPAKPPGLRDLLRFLYLYQHGVDVPRAAFSTSISLGKATQLVELVKHADAVLARRRDINPHRGGASNLLSHIQRPRWQQLMHRAAQYVQMQDTTHPWNDSDLRTLIGPSRQILLYQRHHFTFLQRVLVMWQLPPGSVRLIISRGRHAKLLEWANEAQLVVQPPPLRGESRRLKSTRSKSEPPPSVSNIGALPLPSLARRLNSIPVMNWCF